MQRFDSALRDFWHGIFSGKKYPVAFYAKKERKALALEVECAAREYARDGKRASSGRLRRFFEFINTYIPAKNLYPHSISAPKNVFPKFLRLLYCGKKPSSFWAHFREKYSLPSRKRPAEFWDYFEEFQPKRLEISGWLSKNAKGKILDIGSGSHSYIPVDCALDASAKALAKNKGAKRKIVFDMDKKSSLPFPSASFDTIMLNSILAYAAKPKALLADCHRVLKPAGALLITNAPVSDYHPAKYFEKNKITGRKLAIYLADAGFDSIDESEGQTIRIIASKT